MAALAKSRHSPHRRTKVVAGELVLSRASRRDSNSLLLAELKDRFARHKLQCRNGKGKRHRQISVQMRTHVRGQEKFVLTYVTKEGLAREKGKRKGKGTISGVLMSIWLRMVVPPKILKIQLTVISL